jgi:hypothetical protein
MAWKEFLPALTVEVFPMTKAYNTQYEGLQYSYCL